MAIIGGGAVTRLFYLPMFQSGVDGIHLVAVVEPSSSTLLKLPGLPQGALTINQSFQAYFGALTPGTVDAVVVALPHHLHEECVTAALKKGLHVFCEKPLGLSAGSVFGMLETSNETGCTLAVCQPRRSFGAARAIHELLQTGWMGSVLSVTWHEGQPYAWPAESLSQVLEEHGGGELFDIGAHVFDLLSWWLGDLKLIKYSDDSAGGTAADYHVELETASGAPVDVRFSRLYPLSNAVTIKTERGRIHWELKNREALVVATAINGRKQEVAIGLQPQRQASMLDAVKDQLLEFAKSISQLPNNSVGPHEALKCARIFDECRRLQRRKQRTSSSTGNRRVVVTGAGGFIGTRLVEMLDDRGYSVLGLARRAQSCVRLARRAIDIRLSNVCEYGQLDEALRGGGDVIFHCAVAAGDKSVVWPTIVDGTMNVLRAAEQHGYRRVVVFSSMLVFGDPPADGDVDDDSLPGQSELEYARAKHEMERRCTKFAATSRVEVVILRPTCVFGPFARDFGTAHLDRQARGEFFLTDGGSGLANLVYVDNLVDAAILAATDDCPSGTAMIINEEEWPTSWTDFFLPQIKRAFGDDANVLELTTSDLVRLGAEHKRNRSFPAVFRHAVRSHAACAEWVSSNRLFRGWKALRNWWARDATYPQPHAPSAEPVRFDQARSTRLQLESSVNKSRTFPYGQFFLSFYTTQATYRSERARSLLGWRPGVDRNTALRETLEWVERTYPASLRSNSDD